jgi:two-component system, LytTR family, sensor histidine kinase AlgZ
MHPLFATRFALPVYLLAWTALAVVPWVIVGPGPAVGRAVVALLATWMFSLFTLPGYYVCRSLPLSPRHWRRSLGVQITVALIWSGTYLAAFELLARLAAALTPWKELSGTVAGGRAELFGVGLLLSLLAMAFHHLALSIEARGVALEREQSSLLARQRAELGALRAQVHPHFLFNSLNTVSALIGYDPAGARQACIELGTYLRGALGAGERTFVSLREEWELAEMYLGVEALRLGERLQIVRELDPAALERQVPSLILQPLIENAITHGVSRVTEPSPLRVRATERDGRLVVEIENPIAARGPSGRGGGLGLSNVRARLSAHYGTQASLGVVQSQGTFLARLELPAAEVRS